MLFLAGLGDVDRGFPIPPKPSSVVPSEPGSLPMFRVPGAKFVRPGPIAPIPILPGPSGKIGPQEPATEKNPFDQALAYVIPHVDQIMNALDRTPLEERRNALEMALNIYRRGGIARVEGMATRQVLRGANARAAFRDALARELAATVFTIATDAVVRMDPVDAKSDDDGHGAVGCLSCGVGVLGLGEFFHPGGDVWFDDDMGRVQKAIWYTQSAQALLSNPNLLSLSTTYDWDGEKLPVLEYLFKKAVHNFRRRNNGPGPSRDAHDYIGSLYRGSNLAHRLGSMSSAELKQITPGLLDILRAAQSVMVAEWEADGNRQWPNSRMVKGTPRNWRDAPAKARGKTLRQTMQSTINQVGADPITAEWAGWTVGKDSGGILSTITNAAGKVVDVVKSVVSPVRAVVGAVTNVTKTIACDLPAGIGAKVVSAATAGTVSSRTIKRTACGTATAVDTVVQSPAPRRKASPPPPPPPARPKPKPKPKPKPRPRPAAVPVAAPAPGMSTGTKVAIGAGAVAVIALLAMGTKKSPTTEA